MRKYVVLGLMIALCGCAELGLEQPSDSEPVIEEVESKPKPSPKKKLEYPYLTNDNAVEFLTQYGKDHPQTRIVVTSEYGEFELELFTNTPLHRANFLYMIERDYYTPTEVVRIVKDFVVQSGNSDKEIPAFKRSIIGRYTIPDEMNSSNLHFTGALAASRSYEDNPDKRSSPYDFYIVDGKTPSKAEIQDVKINGEFKHSQAQIESYKKRGGAIHLDGQHTVFGRVVKGMNVIEAIAEVKTDDREWPDETINFDMRVKE